MLHAGKILLTMALHTEASNKVATLHALPLLPLVRAVEANLLSAVLCPLHAQLRSANIDSPFLESESLCGGSPLSRPITPLSGASPYAPSLRGMSPRLVSPLLAPLPPIEKAKHWLKTDAIAGAVRRMLQEATA